MTSGPHLTLNHINLTNETIPDGSAEPAAAEPHDEPDLGVLVVEVGVALPDDAGDDEFALGDKGHERDPLAVGLVAGELLGEEEGALVRELGPNSTKKKLEEC